VRAPDRIGESRLNPQSAVDAKQRLPDELRDHQEAHPARLIPPVEEHADVPEQEERSADQPEPGLVARNARLPRSPFEPDALRVDHDDLVLIGGGGNAGVEFRVYDR
jgi:hypothetical protein